MQVYSCLEKQEVNFSSWLSTEVDLPGQRLVCKAFYPFPGYTTGAGRETTELTSRMKAVSGLSWGCFTAAKLHWPQQCSHKQEEIPPWVAECGFSQRIFFSCTVFLFSVPTFIFPGKFCRLVCGCTLLSHFFPASHVIINWIKYRKQLHRTHPVWLMTQIRAIKQNKNKYFNQVPLKLQSIQETFHSTQHNWVPVG